jgi:oligopeptide transport system permease protein
MAESTLAAAAFERPTHERGLYSDAFRRLRKNRVAVVALIVLTVLTAVAFAAQYIPAIERYDPARNQDTRAVQEGPSWDHWMGTDNLGRDNWARVLEGIRISLIVGVGAQAVALVIGLAVGAGAALGGRWLDGLLMRITDITYAFPDLLFIILVRAVLSEREWPVVGNSLVVVILAIGTVNWTTLARLVRGQMLSLRERDYVLAATNLGASQSRIVFRHMLPNVIGPVIVAVTFGIPIAIFAEAALGFIGLGLPPPTASLGRLVSDGYNFIQINIWVVIFPALAVALLMLAFTFVGDGLRDALDPRSR